MARVTHVKAAQQRFQTVPVIDPITGEQKRTPVMQNGVQKQSKRGPVFLSVSEPDLTKPLPNYTCDGCGKEILVGQPYKHVTPKSGPYGGRKRTRCGTCPAWQVWELSQSLSARTAEIMHNAHEAFGEPETTEAVTEVLSNVADEIRSLAEEKRESASNIEDGFGHPTSASEELNEIADQLESWADDVENADIPDFPEPEEDDCEECEGTGRVDTEDADAEGADDNGQVECAACSGNGQMTPEEPTEEQVDNWRSEVEDAFNVVDECPV